MDKIRQSLFIGFISIFVMSSGFAQNSLHFDGFDDYISTTYSGIGGNSARTVEAWIKAPTVASQIIITDWGTFATGSRFTVSLINGFLRAEVQGSGQTGTTLLGDNAWHHIAVTYDNALSTNKFSMFIDGALEMSFDLPTTVNTGSSVNLQIGLRVDGLNSFSGNIQEVRVWNYARSLSQISTNMNSEYCGPVNGLVAYYKLNQGIAGGTNTTVTSASDASGNANNGTLNNFGLTSSTSNWIAGQSLNLIGSVSVTQTLMECTGYSVTVGTNTYSSTGVYLDTIFGGGAAGCDSIITTDLTINSASFSTQTLSECAGSSVTVGTNTYNTTGIYLDTLFGASLTGCDSIVTTDVTFGTAINVAITSTGSSITASSSTATYRWLDCDNSNAVIAGETGQTFSPGTNGNYAVEITEGSCVDTSACESINGVGINENVLNHSIRLYPNPTNGIVNLVVADYNGTVHINVIDISGKSHLVISNSSANAQLDLSQLKSGVYFVQVTTALSKRSIKVIRN